MTTSREDRDMTINFDLDTMFTNTQKLATLIKDDPNPHRTAYVRLIGELEAALLAAYRSGDKNTKNVIIDHLDSLIRRQRAELTKREEDAEVRRRLEAYSE
jgi:hypothetical protein